MSKTYRTVLSSSRFVVNCVDGNAEHLTKLFIDMGLETAKNILDPKNSNKLHRPSAKELEIPDDMVVD